MKGRKCENPTFWTFCAKKADFSGKKRTNLEAFFQKGPLLNQGLIKRTYLAALHGLTTLGRGLTTMASKCPDLHSTIGCVYLTHILQKPCSTTTMAVYAIYEATAKKLEFASGKSCLATLF